MFRSILVFESKTMAIFMREFSDQEIKKLSTKKLSIEELENARGGYTYDPGPGHGFEVRQNS